MNDTKEHILNVAFNLFLRKSYKEVTMAELVKNSGMSKGAFYHYFNSKEELFLEVINSSLTSFAADYDVFNKDSLREFYHQYIGYLEKVLSSSVVYGNTFEDALNINYFSMIFDALKLFPSFQAKMLEIERYELDSWKKIISTARTSGEIKTPMTDEQIAKIFIYTNDGISLRSIMMKVNPKESVSIMQALWDSFYEELKA